MGSQSTKTSEDEADDEDSDRTESPAPSSESSGSDTSKDSDEYQWISLSSASTSPERPRKKISVDQEEESDEDFIQTSLSKLSVDIELQNDLEEYKLSLRRTYEYVTEGGGISSRKNLLNRIFTFLRTVKVDTEDMETPFVKQLEIVPIKIIGDDPIKFFDIFKPLPDQQGAIRVVLTKGVAGVGKTFSVMKFTLDWAEGLENQDVSLLVLNSFKELNLIRDQQLSLLQLLQVLHPTLEKITAEKLTVLQLLFIFDGLDESRLSLDFSNMKVVTDVTQTAPVNVLLTNLIQGNLLPSARIWITSRHGAANQIPPSCVHRLTEVRGFTDDQKDQYFRKRTTDEELSNRIISHVRTSKNLHIMCQIPIFCWISATVLEDMLTSEQTGELPRTLTDLYSHFLLVQTKSKKNKYSGGQEIGLLDRDVLLKLGRLGFERLQKGNIMFYQEDLDQCGLDVTQAIVYSGVCTEIFTRQSLFFKKSVYCFVHLSVQEFLAAVYMFHCYTKRETPVLQAYLGKKYKYDSSVIDFLSESLKKCLQSSSDHLDLFVHFLHGLCLESNQDILRPLLGQTHLSPEVRGIVPEVIINLKVMNTTNLSPDRTINILHCLTELKDPSVHQLIQEFPKS